MDMTLPMNTEFSQDRNDARLDSLRAIALDKGKNDKMNEREMNEVASQFEGMVVRQLLKEMRKTVPQEGGAIPQSHASQMYMDMVDDHWAQEISKTDSFGIKRMIVEELKAKQEKIQDPTGDQGFMTLRSNGEDDLAFIPLNQNGSNFMNLPSNEPEFLNLPKRDPFMPLNGNLHISTANIENWEDARK